MTLVRAVQIKNIKSVVWYKSFVTLIEIFYKTKSLRFPIEHKDYCCFIV